MNKKYDKYVAGFIGVGSVIVALFLITQVVSVIEASDNNCLGVCAGQEIRKANKFCISQGYINSTNNFKDIGQGQDDDWLNGEIYKTTYCVVVDNIIIKTKEVAT